MEIREGFGGRSAIWLETGKEESLMQWKEEMETREESIPGRKARASTEVCVPGTSRRVWLKHRRPMRA